MSKITPFLWFDNNVEEAMDFYLSVFKNGKVKEVTRYGDAGPGPKGAVMTASFELPDGGAQTATITTVTPGEGADARWTVQLTPAELTPEQITQLQGSNVRVSIPVGATEGEVLSVPLAALTAGPGGESRVEVVDGDPRDGDRAQTRLVVVETGLAADGAVDRAVEPAGLPRRTRRLVPDAAGLRQPDSGGGPGERDVGRLTLEPGDHQAAARARAADIQSGQYSHSVGTKRKTSPATATRPTDGNGR